MRYKNTIKAIGLVLFSIAFLSSQAAAISTQDLQSVQSNTEYYWPNSCGTTTSTPTLTGTDNITQAFNYFMAKNELAPTQIAGLLGNLYAASNGLVPTTTSDGLSDPTPIPGVGFGIAQWTTAVRQQGLTQLASSQGVLPTSLGVQLDYIWQELTTSYQQVLVSLEADSDLTSASDTILTGYLPDTLLTSSAEQIQTSEQIIISYATAILALYGASAQATSSTDTSTTQGTTNCGSGGTITGCDFGTGKGTFSTDTSIVIPGVQTMCARVAQLINPSSALFAQWCKSYAVEHQTDGQLCYEECEGTVAFAWQFESYSLAIDEYFAAVASGTFHPKNTDPPVGAVLLYYYAPYSDAGHAAIYLGNDMAMSTDLGHLDYVNLVNMADLNPFGGGPGWDTPNPTSGYLGWAYPGHPSSPTF